MTFKHFEDLPIGQAARKQRPVIFAFTIQEGLSKEYRLKDQIRASAGSVMDNIAEGFGRGGNKEFVNFLSVARGSHAEVRSQVYQLFDIGYISVEELNDFVKQSQETEEQISAFMQFLLRSDYKGSKFIKPL